ncbi:MAG: MBL fold metallo-hydrolase [Thermoplasmatota archaeon]
MRSKEDEATILTILYDNRAESRADENVGIVESLGDNDFKADWGVSIHIKKDDKDILFDVGHYEDILSHNMSIAGIEIDDIDIIVISHRHWDHIGGLSMFEDNNVSVYVPKSLVKRIKKEFDLSGDIIPVESSVKICDGVYSTGQLGRAVKEQSLIVEGKDGLYILTGCGHPGINNIIKKTSKRGDVKGIIGGYHGFSDIDSLADIALLVPCHCTMLLDKIKEKYPKAFKRCNVGSTIDI